MGEIRTILLDLDDTLMPEYGPVTQAFDLTCQIATDEACVDRDALHESIRRRARQLWRTGPAWDYSLRIGISSWEGLTGGFDGPGEDLALLRRWTPGYQLQAWSQALAEHGVKDAALAARLAETFGRIRLTQYVAHPEAEAALQSLAERYRLAVITNGAPQVQASKLAATGLADWFELVVISGDLGVGKPDPRIFEHTLERLGITASQAVMVGNSLKRDVAGAQGVGMKAVWVNADEEPVDGTVEPDVEIAHVGELPEALSRLVIG